jgi:hypothetical protein
VAVERLDNPALVGAPVIVGGRAEVRGVVASASYEARACGVHSAMPTAQALRLCPQAILISGHRTRYVEMSRRVMAVLAGYTPLLEPISRDEAFLDVTGTEDRGPPGHLANAIQNASSGRSLGIAWGGDEQTGAKIASDLRKPSVMVPLGRASFLPCQSKLWGVGRTGRSWPVWVQTIGDLYCLARLCARFGSGEGGRPRDGRQPGHAGTRPNRSAVRRHLPKMSQTLLSCATARLSDGVAARLRGTTQAHRLAEAALWRLHYDQPSGRPDATDAGPAIYSRVHGVSRPGSAAAPCGCLVSPPLPDAASPPDAPVRTGGLVGQLTPRWTTFARPGDRAICLAAGAAGKTVGGRKDGRRE